MLSFFFLLLANVPFVLSALADPPQTTREVPVSNPICKMAKDRGNSCPSGSAGIKWYFDTDTLQCLAFGYKGCGGNANRFATAYDCRQSCPLPMDFGGCSGQKPSAKDDQGRSITCSFAGSKAQSQERQCPNGYRCRMLAFFGVCCHTETEEMYNRNFRPKCANGKEPHKVYDAVNKWHFVYLGKCCSDEFCPDGTTCHQQEIFAHCCPK